MLDSAKRASPRSIRRTPRSKRALLRNSGRVAAGVLNEKLETGAPFAIGDAEGLDTVVLEADAPEFVARAFSNRGLPRSPRAAR